MWWRRASFRGLALFSGVVNKVCVENAEGHTAFDLLEMVGRLPGEA